MTERHQLLCRYHYDPLDRLAACARPTESDVRFFYRKHRLATQVQGILRHSIVEADDLLLAQQQSSAGTTQNVLLITDRQRSVLGTLQGDQQQALAYTAHGYLSAQSGLNSVLGFNGERRDPLTGCYLLGNGYRASNPVLMRFNSPDSLSPFGKGGLNSYAYCLGDPVNHQDPDGHFALIGFQPLLAKLGGASMVLSIALGIGAAVMGAVTEDKTAGIALTTAAAVVGLLGSAGLMLRRQSSVAWQSNSRSIISPSANAPRLPNVNRSSRIVFHRNLDAGRPSVRFTNGAPLAQIRQTDRPLWEIQMETWLRSNRRPTIDSPPDYREAVQIASDGLPSYAFAIRQSSV